MSLPLTFAGSSASAMIPYYQKVLSINSANLITYWPLWETAGLTADNLEGTAARDGTYNGVTLNSTTFTNGDPAALWDGSNDYCNIYSASLDGVFNGQLGTIAAWIKMANAGVWTDGQARDIFRIRVNSSNYLDILRTTTNNELQWTYVAGGTTKVRQDTSIGGSTAWHHVAMTWNRASDRMRAFLDGSQIGADLTGLGAWAGNLAANNTLIGAATTGPVVVWSGYIAHVPVWSSELTPAQIADLATV